MFGSFERPNELIISSFTVLFLLFAIASITVDVCQLIRGLR